MSLRAPTASPTLATRLAARVRTGRAARRLTRANLADASGLSMAYLARLEGAQANPSLEVLTRLATALQLPPHALIAPEEPEWAPPQAATIAPRIALIGLRGAGKSTLGRMAAEKLGWRFIELNKEIEREAGFSVGEVFSLYGQDGYRRYEAAALERIIAEPGAMILATGGGIVSEPVTFERLLASFFTIWVKTSPAEHMSRVRKQGDLRPMGADKAAMTELITILQSREPFYARARMSLDTTNATLEQSLAALLRTIQSYCVSGCPWQSRNRS